MKFFPSTTLQKKHTPTKTLEESENWTKMNKDAIKSLFHRTAQDQPKSLQEALSGD